MRALSQGYSRVESTFQEGVNDCSSLGGRYQLRSRFQCHLFYDHELLSNAVTHRILDPFPFLHRHMCIALHVSGIWGNGITSSISHTYKPEGQMFPSRSPPQSDNEQLFWWEYQSAVCLPECSLSRDIMLHTSGLWSTDYLWRRGS
jgi:hypothetical protein